ncbi:MAG: amidohydrolase family protein [Burkholderiales bacterium]|nr:amidohydrolase family protein [Burkholderiales bacterium]
MKRRRFLWAGAAAVAGTAGLAACRWWPEQGLWNPCLPLLPPELAEHDLVRAAWFGIDAAKVWDCHVHLVGTGDSGSGIYIHPGMNSLLDPAQYARRLFFMNAGCVHAAEVGEVDRAYVARMLNLMAGLRPGVRLLLYAFERTHDAQGKVQWGRTGFYVPNGYARDVAGLHPEFEWAASIHPYRADALDALERAAAEGARAVKWLPPAMGIDPASPRCMPFYRLLARLDLPLISHAGEERAVLGAEAHDLGNPLRLRAALDAGVRVVAAHCSSLGEDRDLDRGPNGPYVPSFGLFARMMDTPATAGRLYGDISAVTQLNRATDVLVTLLEREDWHPRLLNGSDYPLPGVMPIFSVRDLVARGLLEPAAEDVLKTIRGHNPLLFDFVLKRTLRANGSAFAPSVFETRAFFLPRAAR